MASRVAISGLLAAALAAGGCDRQSPRAEQANVAADEVASDEVAPDGATAQAADKVDRSHRGEAAIDAGFTDPDGKPVTLAAFRGRPVVVNLWATWCAPCVKEMPTLDTLAGTLGDKARVIVVSQDLDPAKVPPFFAARKFANLAPYTDPKLALSLGYGANLPTTFLFDADGREVWRVTGEMDWTGAQARALLADL